MAHLSIACRLYFKLGFSRCQRLYLEGIYVEDPIMSRPTTMKAVVFEGARQVAVRDRPVPQRKWCALVENLSVFRSLIWGRI